MLPLAAALLGAVAAPLPPAHADGLLSFISERDGNREVYLLDLDQRTEQRLTRSPLADYNGPATPDGKSLLVTAGKASENESSFAFLLYPLTGVGTDKPGSAAKTLLADQSALLNPSFTPDGKFLIYEAGSEGFRDLFQIALGPTLAAVRKPQQLTRNPEGNFNPALCARSKLLAFTSSRDRASEVYRMRLDGSELRRLTYSAGSKWRTLCAPSGDRIYFISDRDGADRIYGVHPNGSEPKRLTRRNLDPYVVEESPAISPDGRLLAFIVRAPPGNAAAGAHLHVVDLSTGAERELPTPKSLRAAEPAWSPSPRSPRLAFTLQGEPPGGVAAQIYVMDAALARCEQVTRGAGPNWHPLWIR